MEDHAILNEGLAVGGPAHGKTLASEFKTIVIPIQVGPNRGEGDRGFGAFRYEFKFGMWIWQH